VHVGDATVRSIDGRFDYVLVVGISEFDVKPGPHRVVLAYEKTARSIGYRDVPEKRGEGVCVLDFVAEAGREYQVELVAEGADWTLQRWDGKWKASLRDRALPSPEGVIASCVSGKAPADIPSEPALVITPLPAPTAMAVSVPAAAAAAPVAAVVVPVAADRGETRDERGQVRIGGWTLRAAPRRDWQRVASVVEDHFDLLAFNLTAPEIGLARLAAALGDGWDVSTAGSEYGFARRKSVPSCAGWSGARGLGEAGRDLRFAHPPRLICFELPGGGERWLLSAYRATRGGGSADEVADEVGQVGALFAAMRSATKDASGAIIAGDLNLTPAEVHLVTDARIDGSGGGSVLDLLGVLTPGVRDYVLVEKPESAPASVGTVLDVRGVAGDGKAFRDTVSDHLPVRWLLTQGE